MLRRQIPFIRNVTWAFQTTTRVDISMLPSRMWKVSRALTSYLPTAAEMTMSIWPTLHTCSTCSQLRRFGILGSECLLTGHLHVPAFHRLSLMTFLHAVTIASTKEVLTGKCMSTWHSSSWRSGAKEGVVADGSDKGSSVPRRGPPCTINPLVDIIGPDPEQGSTSCATYGAA